MLYGKNKHEIPEKDQDDEKPRKFKRREPIGSNALLRGLPKAGCVGLEHMLLGKQVWSDKTRCSIKTKRFIDKKQTHLPAPRYSSLEENIKDKTRKKRPSSNVRLVTRFVHRPSKVQKT
jgi:hypothetical protein